MAHKYPFKNTEELKAKLSGIDVSLDLKNLNSGFTKAVLEAKDMASAEVYQIMINHYNSETEDPILDELVEKYQEYMANYAMYEHFIWLALRVSNGSITVTKTDRETTAYKYLTDEAKENLLESAHIFADEIINFLNANATKWTDWTKATDYILDQKIRNESVFYKCTTPHTSGDAIDLTKFAVIETENIKLWQWIASDEYKDQEDNIFDNYKEFCNIVGIDKTSYFYYKLRSIISRVVDNDLKPRVFEAIESGSAIERNVKRAVGFKVMSIACSEFDYYTLPSSIRKTIANEVYKSEVKEQDVKDRMAASYADTASKYFYNIERDIVKAKDLANDEVTPPYVIENKEENSHASML